MGWWNNSATPPAMATTLKGYGFGGFDQFSLSLLKSSTKSDQATQSHYDKIFFTDHTLLTLPKSRSTQHNCYVSSSWDNLFIHIPEHKLSYASKKWYPLLSKALSKYCTYNDDENISRVWPVQWINKEIKWREDKSENEIKGEGQSLLYVQTTSNHIYLISCTSQSIFKLNSSPLLHCWSFVDFSAEQSCIYYVTLSGNLYTTIDPLLIGETSGTLLHRDHTSLPGEYKTLLQEERSDSTLKEIIDSSLQEESVVNEHEEGSSLLNTDTTSFKETSSDFLKEKPSGTTSLQQTVNQINTPHHSTTSLQEDNGCSTALSDHQQCTMSHCRSSLLQDKVLEVANGPTHVLILTDKGAIYSFGSGSHGELGHGNLTSLHNEPQLIEALAGISIRGVACGSWHSLAVSGCGDVYSWGWNQHGQLGHSHTHSVVSEPTLVQGISEEVEIIKVSCGSRHSACLSADGKCYVWGWNGYGQIPYNEEEIVRSPVLLIDTVYDVMCCHWSTIIRTMS